MSNRALLEPRFARFKPPSRRLVAAGATLVALFAVMASNAWAQTTYTWNGGATGSWIVDTNWSPARTTPDTTDIMLVNTTATITAVPPQKIGQLQITGNSAVTLQNSAVAMLTLSGGAGVDLSVDAGSSLSINAATNAAFTLNLLSGTTGSISGGMTYSSASANTINQFLAADASAVTFNSGSTFNQGPFSTGSIFGTVGTANAFVFAGGSTFNQQAGSNPFGLAQPASRVVFQTGSTFRMLFVSTPGFSGRTYANFEWNAAGTATVTGGNPNTLDNLTVSQGTFNYNMTGTVHSIKGNVTVASGATLNFNPATAATVALNGASAQTITNSGTLTSSNLETFNVNNSNGINLGGNVTIGSATAGGGVTFTAGRINTGANTLTIASGANVTGAGAGWVNGRLKRTVPTAGARTLDIGDASSYTPVALQVNGLSGPFDLTASTTAGDHPQVGTSGLDPSKSVNRYYTLTPAAAPTFTNYDATFNFAGADVDLGANTASFLVHRYDGATWNATGTGLRTPTSTQATGVTSFSDFAIGEAQSWTITASAGAGGSIAPSGAVTVADGANQDFTITANAGFQIADVVVDGGSVGAVASYTFSGVHANHTIAASFSQGAATIAAQSTATYICPTNSCVTLPVTIDRTSTTAVLGFSVTIQLSANLALCSGTGSITEGTFLSSVGPTLFNVIDNGGGSYTVDGAVFGPSCGPTATSGTLFSVGVTSASADGSGSITVSNLALRDCANGPLPTTPGAPGTVPIDNQAPAVTVGSPNGGESFLIGTSQTISWTATDNTGVANVDLAYSTDGGATFPHTIATGVANSGTFAWTVPNSPTTQARVRVTAHDVVCSSGSDASDANFTIRDPIITASAGAGGSISPNGAVSVPYATDQAFTITAAACQHIVDVLVDGSSVGAVTTHTFTNVTVDHTIAASFAINTYTIAASAGGGGSISPSGSVSVDCGADQIFTITADACHTVSDVLVDGGSVGALGTYTFTNVQASHTIAASFALKTYAITASAGAHGSIAPSGAVTVNCGADQAFAITADACYAVADVMVDGASVGAVTSYTFVNVTAAHTIDATFAIATQYTIVATAGAGGSINPSGNVLVDCGADQSFTISPNSGFTIHDVVVDGASVGAVATYTFTNVLANHTIDASFTANNLVVVSQIFGGGGNGGAPFHNDYIELFNRGDTAANLTGWTVQYGSSGGTTWFSTPLSGSIPPGGYYLVQEIAGAGGGAALPAPDATGTISMSATAGKVAVVSNATLLTGTCPSSTAILDLVGYGAANCSEGSPTGALGNSTAALRVSGGCEDTNNNLADFTIGAPAPRNSASPAHSCQYTLTVTVDPSGSGSVDKAPDQPTYQHGSSVTLTAVPSYGFHFVKWTGDASGLANPLTVVLKGNKSIVAHFGVNTSSGVVVISQVYGGGGNGGAPYHNDYIELFNRGNATANITGWSVQYASATGTGWVTTALVGSIPPGGYYLVQEAAGTGGGVGLPTPDATGTIVMSATAGKVVLTSNSVTLTGSCPSGANIVDRVGYGAADCSETAPTAALTNTTAALRKSGGCEDNDNNSADFTAAAPSPRNSSSPANFCPEWLSVDDAGATEFALGPAVPNPTRGALKFEFALQREAPVRLRMLDPQGRVVATLAEGVYPAGRHQVAWSGFGANGAAKPGVYFIHMEITGKSLVRKVALMR